MAGLDPAIQARELDAKAADALEGNVAEAEIDAALASPSRPANDRVLDTVRHPRQVLAFTWKQPWRRPKQPGEPT